MFVSGDYAFLAVGWQGVQVIDVSNPKSPKLAGSLKLSGFAERIFVSRDYIYLAVKKKIGQNIIAQNLPVRNAGYFQVVKIIK